MYNRYRRGLRQRGAGELRSFPPIGGDAMPQGRDRQPRNKKEEQDRPLAKAVSLAPLFAVILQALELLLKLLGIVR